MHARTSELLSLRDGEPVAVAVRQHVESCPHCTAELARLAALRENLRRLPLPVADDMPQAEADISERWTRISEALRSAPATPRASNRYLAFAAGLVWAAVALVWFVLAGDSSLPPVAGTEQPRADFRAEPMPGLETLVRQSQHLESMLLTLPRRPRVEQAATAATLDALEQRIQLLDYAMSNTSADDLPAEQAEVLWRERVQLLDSLVALRYVQAERTHF